MNRSGNSTTIFRSVISLLLIATIIAGMLVGCRFGGGDVRPVFGIGESLNIGPFIVGVPVSEMLPEASGGNGDLIYSLTPVPEGLHFDAIDRMLTGVPERSSAGRHEAIYGVKDADGDRDETTVAFTISTNTPRPRTPVVAIEAERSVATEGTPVRFTVRAVPAPAAEVEVSWSETGAMLTESPPSTVTIPTSGIATLTADTIDDATAEFDSTVTAMLDRGAGYRVGSPASDGVRVEDDERARLPRVSLDRVTPTTVQEGQRVTMVLSLESGARRPDQGIGESD